MPDLDPDKQMLDTAAAVADFAHRQGVGDALAVDHLIQRYRASRAEVERQRAEGLRTAEMWARERGHVTRLEREVGRMRGLLLEARDWIEQADGARGIHTIITAQESDDAGFVARPVDLLTRIERAQSSGTT